MTGRSIKPFDKIGEEKVKKQLDKAYEPLRKLTPGLGAYLNEASPNTVESGEFCTARADKIFFFFFF